LELVKHYPHTPIAAKKIQAEIDGLDEAIKQIQIVQTTIRHHLLDLLSQKNELYKKFRKINLSREDRGRLIRQLLSEGWTQSQVAAHLHISQPTVWRSSK
jgi:DNA-binding NarL/FixJ family response regulator